MFWPVIWVIFGVILAKNSDKIKAKFGSVEAFQKFVEEFFKHDVKQFLVHFMATLASLPDVIEQGWDNFYKLVEDEYEKQKKAREDKKSGAAAPPADAPK